MGGLTTHVLDTAQGCPGQGIKLTLYRVTDKRTLVCSAITNADGRTDQPLMTGDDCAPGTYELEFDVAGYFAQHAVTTAEPPFLDQVTLRFSIADDSHYHVPLLVSPWSYSTYRGS